MTPQQIAQIIALARRAPLQNMAEAELAAQLLQNLQAYFVPAQQTQSPIPADAPAPDAPA